MEKIKITKPELAINDFKKKVERNFGEQIESIILFGSVARNEYSINSDIDVLVITQDDKPELAKEIIGIGFEELLNNGWYVSAKVIDKKRFAHLLSLETPFIKNILKEGVLIYGKDFRTKV